MAGSHGIQFEYLCREYQSRIHRLLTRMVGEHEAEDLTQEVFMKVSNSMYAFEGLSDISTWLFSIAKNTAIDRFRGRAYKEEQAASAELELIGDGVRGRDSRMNGKSRTPEDQLIQKEMSACVRRIVDSLPRNERMVIILSEVEGFSDREIAMILNIKPGTVRVRLHRAKAKLKTRLEEACEFYRTKDNTLACDSKPRILLWNKGLHHK